ncbi:hypothetical protein COL26_22225 [Bacillus thuringiensis]|uniref:Uncharacterized protein n=1 Tax=Bacillus thuringiensis TaxID=1428 RepID=A0ABD6SHQ8_BACTU|nr:MULTISPECIES: hypothetical protein [Bacillus cereus group]HEE9035431.1 hypothetical protein [Bacillus cereus]KXY03779.1 hypothetical protein AT260_20595 [Bacillus wiedmannii]MBF7150779.1 hypothetical protein [Bacillus toyonensis]MBZ4221114.1 hypothetical protein [Bacillus wiedmannii]MEC2349804.1 hypothetical protein [Bacillus toyonensis]
MMDFIGEIKKIEKQIENAAGAAGDLANQVVDELQAAKKQIEKEMQRMMLKTEVEFKSIDIIKEDTYALQKNIGIFHDLQTNTRDIASELEKSFESKTGSKINETLKKYEKQINNKIFNEHVHLANSCGKK